VCKKILKNYLKIVIMLISIKIEDISISVESTKIRDSIENVNKVNQLINDMIYKIQNIEENFEEESEEELLTESELDEESDDDSESDEESDEEDAMDNDVDNRDSNITIHKKYALFLTEIKNKSIENFNKLMTKEKENEIYIENTLKSDRLWAHENLSETYTIRSIKTKSDDYLLYFKKIFLKND